MNSTDKLVRNSFRAIDRSQRNSIKKEKCSEKEKERDNKKKGEKDYVKSISYNMSSRRNSKAWDFLTIFNIFYSCISSNFYLYSLL